METDNSRPYQFIAKFWWEMYSIVILQQVWGMLENIDLAAQLHKTPSHHSRSIVYVYCSSSILKCVSVLKVT